MAKKIEKWVVCGADELAGAVVSYVDYDGSILASKDGIEYRTEVYQDWGYCYCRHCCTCTPTMSVRTEKRLA
jgi:hypothetical protein